MKRMPAVLWYPVAVTIAAIIIAGLTIWPDTSDTDPYKDARGK